MKIPAPIHLGSTLEEFQVITIRLQAVQSMERHRRHSSHILDWDMSFGCFFLSSTHQIVLRRTQPSRTIGGTSTPPNEFERSSW
jgi:hypothetical protein